MSFPINITYDDLPPSAALSARIEQLVLRLTRYAPRITSCQVTVRRSEHRHRKGNRFMVTFSVNTPGGAFRASRTSDTDQGHEGAYFAAHDAFDAIRRQLEDFIRERREPVQPKTAHRPG